MNRGRSDHHAGRSTNGKLRRQSSADKHLVFVFLRDESLRVGSCSIDGPAPSADPLTEIKVVERATAAVDRSLGYLAAKQKADGSWHNNNAVNALSLLAFMGRGHTPGHGPYRDILERGKKFLLSSTHKENGYISFSSMYEHGLATLALAEMYGMDPDPDLEKACAGPSSSLSRRSRHLAAGGTSPSLATRT